MNYLMILKFVFFCVFVDSLRAHELLYDDESVDLNWLYGGRPYYGYGSNLNFADDIPISFREPVRYKTYLDYDPRNYYADAEFGGIWNDEPQYYITYETVPQIEVKNVRTETPIPKRGYHYPTPPSTEAPTPNRGYHYPIPKVEYLPPVKEAAVFAPPKPIVTPKSVYLPPTKKPSSIATTYLPPTSKPTIKKSPKPTIPKDTYLPPIVVAEPDSLYLPPSKQTDETDLPQLSSKLQPPPVASQKPIRFH